MNVLMSWAWPVRSAKRCNVCPSRNPWLRGHRPRPDKPGAHTTSKNNFSITEAEMNATSLSPQKITVADLKPIGELPLLLDVEQSGMSAVSWAETYQEDIRE